MKTFLQKSYITKSGVAESQEVDEIVFNFPKFIIKLLDDRMITGDPIMVTRSHKKGTYQNLQ